ncbi:MAG: endo alpha-1,4 polygalactosaminidase [Planctomycetota bacterium]|jgi:cysteinyl-tRNA synthetase
MRPLVLVALLAGCAATTPPERRSPLRDVSAWAIQLQGLDREGALERLERTDAGLVVIDPTRTVRGQESFPTRAVVARLGSGKLCLAYLNVGQAEGYRTYWRPHWRAPTANRPGEPSYLVTVDPEGWEDNYPVAYWDLRWKGVLWGSPSSPLDQALADGFDGVFLDWILGFSDPTIVAAAQRAGVDPADAMVTLVRELRLYVQRRRPGFLLLALNGAALVEQRPEFAAVVDGIVQENLSFSGRAGAKWEDPDSGDHAIPARGDWSTAALARRLQACRDRGLPVFTLDYAADPTNARRARAVSVGLGCVPFVSRTPLDRLPR